MRNLLFIMLTAVLTSAATNKVEEPAVNISVSKVSSSKSAAATLYDSMNLKSILNYKAFEQAFEGYKNLNANNKDILTIIDFSLPSTAKRMYVLDLKNKKLIYHNIVSHGKNSGENYANSFSNRHGSFQSSLGFYLTQNTYQGGNGYSLVLEGLEKGINDQAKPRAVVIHGADYCSVSVIKATGRLGRSYGCPALPRELAKPIINTIKNGSLLYIYADNEAYLAKTNLLKGKKERTLLAEHNTPTNEFSGNLN